MRLSIVVHSSGAKLYMLGPTISECGLVLMDAVIGRLHRLECASGAEYSGFTLGESINSKVLKVSKGKPKIIIFNNL